MLPYQQTKDLISAYDSMYYSVPMSVITVRVKKDVKERLRRYNVNVSEVVRELLDEHLLELEQRDLAERLDSVRERLAGKMDPGQLAEMIRKDREMH
jgi:post-segregation antitoxin (ccd killing protein)